MGPFLLFWMTISKTVFYDCIQSKTSLNAGLNLKVTMNRLMPRNKTDPSTQGINPLDPLMQSKFKIEAKTKHHHLVMSAVQDTLNSTSCSKWKIFSILLEDQLEILMNC